MNQFRSADGVQSLGPRRPTSCWLYPLRPQGGRWRSWSEPQCRGRKTTPHRQLCTEPCALIPCLLPWYWAAAGSLGSAGREFCKLSFGSSPRSRGGARSQVSGRLPTSSFSVRSFRSKRAQLHPVTAGCTSWASAFDSVSLTGGSLNASSLYLFKGEGLAGASRDAGERS